MCDKHYISSDELDRQGVERCVKILQERLDNWNTYNSNQKFQLYAKVNECVSELEEIDPRVERCGFNDGEIPSRWFCECAYCVELCAQWEDEGRTPPQAPQEWYIDRD